jgi:parallel beta-helix repeat protein
LRIVVGFVLLFLLFGLLVVRFDSEPFVRASGVIRVPQDYPTIHAAIDAASSGDTIIVSEGIYAEGQIDVSKSLTLQANGTVVVDGLQEGHVFHIIYASDVTIRGFTIRNSNHTSPPPFYCGIFMDGGSDFLIDGNLIENNCYGIREAWTGGRAVISNNVIVNNSYVGLVAFYSPDNLFTDNVIVNNTLAGISSSMSPNTVIVDNFIAGNSYGIRAAELGTGMTITRNVIADNDYGIYFEESFENRFFHNNFVNNNQQVHCNGCTDHIWDDGYPSGGNYWSEYVDADRYNGVNQNEIGSDGIWDHPYIIENSKDNYPFVNPWRSTPYNVTIEAHCHTEGEDMSLNIAMDGSPAGYATPHTFINLTGIHTFTVPNADLKGHKFKQWSTGLKTPTIMTSANRSYTAQYWATIDIALVDAKPSKAIISQGYYTSVNVTVENQGELEQAFDVTVYANTTTIGERQVTLPPQHQKTITFTWIATGFAKGNYTLWAHVSPVPYETDIEDNSFIGGPILVTITGDVNGDYTVNFQDAVIMGLAFSSKSGDLSWNPNTDLNEDGYINFLDVILMGQNFGQSWT